MKRLYFIYNFHTEKIGIMKFINEQLEQHIDSPKGTEYIMRSLSGLPKGVIKTGSGVFSSLLNNLSNVMPELHLPGYNYCGPFTKLDKILGRGYKPTIKLDAGCQQHDIFYCDHKYTKERHVADEELENIAAERMHASDASVREKIEAAMVRTGMKTNRFLGMGLY